jgi:hypothetical protein
MYATRRIRILAALLSAACVAGMAQAREKRARTVGYENVELSATTRIKELERELGQLRSQVQHGVEPGYEGGGGCGCDYQDFGGCGCDYEDFGCCDCCCDPCCCCCGGGWVGGVELAYLKPHNSSGTGFNTFGVTLAGAPVAAINLEVDPDFEASGRFWFGYQRCDGLGVRLRYWEFDHAFSDGGSVTIGAGAPVSVNVAHNWDVETFDLEVFDSSQLGCYWDATWSLGFRHVEYEEIRAVAGPGVFIAAAKDFSGIGTTGSFELRRCVTDAVSLFGNARASILMDDDDNTLAVALGGFNLAITERQANDVKYIFESQMGLEWTRPICCGGCYFARVGVEMQYWNGFGVSPLGLLFDESAGFGGFFASVGVTR